MKKITPALPLLALVLAACPGRDRDPVLVQPQPPAAPTSANLSIAPIAQQTEVWCWAATAEMVFRYYGLPNVNPAGNYQCGIVGAYSVSQYGPSNPCNFNCFACTAPIGPIANLLGLLVNYGFIANQFGVPSRTLSAQLAYRQLSMIELAQELDAGRPVLAGVGLTTGIALPGISQHFVVLTGYDATAVVPFVRVNDPFPYAILPLTQNPYVQVGGVEMQPGRYVVPYDILVAGLRWNNTIFGIVPN